MTMTAACPASGRSITTTRGPAAPLEDAPGAVTWITAFAPVKNSAGQTVAALDVDFRVDVYLGELAAVRRRFYLHSLAGAVLALIAGVLLARQITRPVVQLSGLARGIVEGHFATSVRITARDEIGMLGNVLHLMAERLNVSHRSMTEVLVRALEARGEATGSLRRLADASALVSERLELSPVQREALELGALLHDIGEIRVPEAVLQKRERLSVRHDPAIRRRPGTGFRAGPAVVRAPSRSAASARSTGSSTKCYPRDVARLVLVNPPSPEPVRTPLLSFCYLAESLRRAGHEVAVLDGSAPNGPRDLISRIEAFAPSLVGLQAPSNCCVRASVAP